MVWKTLRVFRAVTSPRVIVPSKAGVSECSPEDTTCNWLYHGRSGIQFRLLGRSKVTLAVVFPSAIAIPRIATGRSGLILICNKLASRTTLAMSCIATYHRGHTTIWYVIDVHPQQHLLIMHTLNVICDECVSISILAI